MKKENKRDWVKILLIISLMIAIFTNIYLSQQIDDYKELNTLLCELANEELGLLELTYPAYVEKQCNDINDIEILDNGTKEYLCNSFKEIKLPEKFDCESW